MLETPKSISSEEKPSIITRIVAFIRRLRLEFQANLSNNPYLYHPPGGIFSAEAMENIKRSEDEAKVKLGRIMNSRIID